MNLNNRDEVPTLQLFKGDHVEISDVRDQVPRSKSAHYEYDYDDEFRSVLPPVERASSFAEFDEQGSVYRGIPSGACFMPPANHTSELYGAMDSQFNFFDKDSITLEQQQQQQHLENEEKIVLRNIPDYRTLSPKHSWEIPSSKVPRVKATGVVNVQKLCESIRQAFALLDIDILKFSPAKCAWKCVAYQDNEPVVFKVFAWQRKGLPCVEFSLREGSAWHFKQIVNGCKRIYIPVQDEGSNKKPLQFKALSKRADLDAEMTHFMELAGSSEYYDIQQHAAVQMANIISESPLKELCSMKTSKFCNLVKLLQNGHAEVQRCVATVVATLCERGDQNVKSSLVSANVISHLVQSASLKGSSTTRETRRQCCRALSALLPQHKKDIQNFISEAKEQAQKLISVLQGEKSDHRLQKFAKDLSPLIETM